MNIGFLGFGAMAKAIANGLVSLPHQLFAAAPSLTKGVTQAGVHTYNNNQEVIEQVDLLILAVKPQQMSKVIHDINSQGSNTALLISIAAGLSLAWFNERLTKEHALIRCMPNLPAAVGLAATPLFANPLVSPAQKKITTDIFSTIGIIHWLDNENLLACYTALSGSGPAYVFLFIECLVNAAINLGIDTKSAHKFVMQTCSGALKLAQNSHLSLSELKKAVTSPGGTTAAGLKVLEPALAKLINSTLEAAYKRAKELDFLHN